MAGYRRANPRQVPVERTAPKAVISATHHETRWANTIKRHFSDNPDANYVRVLVCGPGDRGGAEVDLSLSRARCVSIISAFLAAGASAKTAAVRILNDRSKTMLVQRDSETIFYADTLLDTLRHGESENTPRCVVLVVSRKHGRPGEFECRMEGHHSETAERAELSLAKQAKCFVDAIRDEGGGFEYRSFLDIYKDASFSTLLRLARCMSTLVSSKA